MEEANVFPRVFYFSIRAVLMYTLLPNFSQVTSSLLCMSMGWNILIFVNIFRFKEQRLIWVTSKKCEFSPMLTHLGEEQKTILFCSDNPQSSIWGIPCIKTELARVEYKNIIYKEEEDTYCDLNLQTPYPQVPFCSFRKSPWECIWVQNKPFHWRGQSKPNTE